MPHNNIIRWFDENGIVELHRIFPRQILKIMQKNYNVVLALQLTASKISRLCWELWEI